MGLAAGLTALCLLDPILIVFVTALLEALRQSATDEGFVLAGVAPAITSAGYHRLVEWVEAGYAGSMDYFAKRLHAYEHPSGVLEGVRSIVVLSYPYSARAVEPRVKGRGRVARYVGSGADYHDVIHPKLRRLGRVIRDEVPDASVRGIVDTAPLMEREFASLAGLGWQGKNTLLLNRQHGSYFFLACLLTTVELPLSEPHATSHCGTCTACLEACPTDAFVGPGTLDASRCISYLTIEHAGAIPRPLRTGIGDWLFGCDVCQEVCPWNRRPMRSAGAERRSETEPETDVAELTSMNLAELFQLDDERFRQRFRKTPFWRTRRRGLLRNAAIVIGNQGDPASIVALTRGLADDDAIVRGAAAWALGRLGGERAGQLLQDRLAIEPDADAAEEIAAALAEIASTR